MVTSPYLSKWLQLVNLLYPAQCVNTLSRYRQRHDKISNLFFWKVFFKTRRVIQFYVYKISVK